MMNKTKEDLQMTYGRLHKRYHIRFWNIGSLIIAGCHMDRISFSGFHTSVDFESVEKDLTIIFKSNSNWDVIDDAVELDNNFRGYGQPNNNGRATIIQQ